MIITRDNPQSRVIIKLNLRREKDIEKMHEENESIARIMKLFVMKRRVSQRAKEH